LKCINFILFLVFTQQQKKEKQTQQKMSTIQVLPETLKGGYAPICDYYNANKPADWAPLSKLQRAEGGFEINLTSEELTCSTAWAYRMGSLMDDNDRIRQLRWVGKGFLESDGHIGFNTAQTELLFKALQHSLGQDQVIMV
jgi:hypothetical protein